MSFSKNLFKQVTGSAFNVALSKLALHGGTSIIFMYHRVIADTDNADCDPAMYITKTTLEMHIREIRKSFEIVPLDAILETSNRRPRLCAITFDDGWRDNYDVAFPILKQYSAPATIFLPANMIGRKKQFWFQNVFNLAAESLKHGLTPEFRKHFNSVINWDAKEINASTLSGLTAALKSLPAHELDSVVDSAYSSLCLSPSDKRYILTWEEVREMGENGVTFGPHGLNHYILPKVNSEIKKAEIVDSLGILKEKKVALSPFFSYPNGDWDNESVDLVREAGYHGALITRLGYNTQKTNPFLLRRVAIHDYISNNPSLLWFRLLQAFGASQ